MNQFFQTLWAWLCPAASGFFVLAFSSSKTSAKNEVADMRVVGGDNSTNTSIKTSGAVNVTATDHGAVKAGMALGTQAIDAAAKSAAGTVASAGSMFDGALTAVSKANEQLADAYQQGQAGDQTTLKIAGFVVVGLAAALLLPSIAKG